MNRTLPIERLLVGKAGSGLFGTILKTLAVWHQRRRARNGLARLDRHMLSDIGLTPGEALNEHSKPFWRD
jgi:uncharacterized protein YjiS (DUF1127 family)